MNILTSYIIREVLKGSFLALLLLLTLFNLYTFSDELKDLGKGAYQLRDILMYLALDTPTVFYELVPTGALIGSIFVLGSMANNSEIIAMRAAGLSLLGIIRSVMLAGMILVSIAMAVGEFIAPDASQKGHLLKNKALNNRVVLKAKYGIWLREGNDFINIRQLSGQTKLSDISFYRLDNLHILKQVKHAQSAEFQGRDHWLLHDVKITHVSNSSVSFEKHATENWQTTIAPDLLDIVVVKASTLSSYDLIKYVDFLKENNQKSQIFEAALWQRLFNPFVTFVMLLVATPFVLGIKRGTSIGGRLIIGIIIGLGFKILDQIISHVGIVYSFNPILTALLPGLLVLIGALYAINRVKV